MFAQSSLIHLYYLKFKNAGAIDNRPYGGFDGAQDLLISLPGADGDEIRSRLAVIIGLQPQALPLGAFHGILSAIR